MELKWFMITIIVTMLGAYAGIAITKHSNNWKQVELAKILAKTKECK